MMKELTIKGNYDIAAPSQMADMAKVLKKHITEQGLSTNIMGKNYINVEGWQFAGGLMGYLPKVVKIENISQGNEKKWRADVELIRIKDDKIMGTGSAICSNAEGKKKSFDEYAIMSMAQTRAIGKAYRNLIGWVMKMGGYEATPSEEMVKMGEQAKPATQYQPKQAAKQPVKPQAPAKPAVSDLLKLKDKLAKLGAKTLSQAIAKYNSITGENIKSLAVSPARAKEMLFNLLNSPISKK